MESDKQQLKRLLKLAKNKSVLVGHYDKILEDWRDVKREISEGNFGAISNFLLTLREYNVEFPLELTLLFKNLSSINSMATNAGFSNGLIGALAYEGERNID